MDLVPPSSSDPKVLLPLRSAQRWSHLIHGKPELAYEYLSPEYRAAQNSIEYATQINGQQVTSTRVNYVGPHCDSSEACNVSLKIEAKLNAPKTDGLETIVEVDENWVKSEGHWYFVPRARR